MEKLPNDSKSKHCTIHSDPTENECIVGGASVTDSLEFARKRLQLEDFEDFEGTEIFLRTIDRIFDTLKVSSRVEGVNQQQLSFSFTKTWIINFKNSTGDRLVRTQKYIGFTRMRMNINTIQNLTAEYLKN